MIVSLTIVRYRKRFIPMALLAMGMFRTKLHSQQGCTFFKLLGSSKAGTFQFKPDWCKWALLAVWNDRMDFDDFYSQSYISKWWDRFTTERWTILMEPLQSRGTWDGVEPFGKTNRNDYNGLIVVLTRATISHKKIRRFWAHVADVEEAMRKSDGYLMSLGIGELYHLAATFSVWRDKDSMQAFAYQRPQHVDVIKKTRDEHWHKEDLFARFKPLESFGTIDGADPLSDIIKFD